MRRTRPGAGDVKSLNPEFAERTARPVRQFYASQNLPPSCPTASLAPECTFNALNRCAKHQQRQALLSAPTKSLCREGLREYAPLHAPIVHCMRPCEYHDRWGWPKPLVGDAAQAARRRDSRRAPGTRARPSAGAVGQFANAAVPRDSVAHRAAPPLPLYCQARRAAADFANEGRYV